MDKDQAHDVEKFSAEYAGLPIWELAKYMHGLSPETVKDTYKSEIAALTSKNPLDQCYQERAAKSIAVLTTTAKLAASALSINFHENEILEFFFENLKGGVPENESRRAFDFITNKCCEYQSKFPDYHIVMNDKPNYLVAKKDCWGYLRKDYNRKDGKSELNTDLLVIVKDKFLQWMNEGGFNKDNILREWKALEIISLSKPDHYYSDVVLHKGAPKTKCLRIALDNNAYSFDSPKKDTEKFSDIFCKRVLEAEYERYASEDRYAGMLEAVRKSVEKLTEENLEIGLSEEIIKNCIKVEIDFSRVQSYLYGKDYDNWKSSKTEDTNNDLLDDDQSGQEILE